MAAGTHGVVALPSARKGLQFGGHERRRGDHLHASTTGQPGSPGGGASQRVPAVAETQYIRERRHDIDRHASHRPPADRRAGAHVLLEAPRPQLGF